MSAGTDQGPGSKPLGGSVTTILRKFARGDVANVSCGTCTACCRRYAVSPEPGDSLELFTAISEEGKPMLPHSDDRRTCTHLVGGKCSIYDKRPWACKRFDCRPLAISRLGVGPGFMPDELADALRQWDVPSGFKEEHDLALSYVLGPIADSIARSSGCCLEHAVGAAVFTVTRKSFNAIAAAEAQFAAEEVEE